MSSKSKDWGLVLAAAGSGTRFGGTTPKQFVDLDGCPVYLHSLRKLMPAVDEAVVVVPETWVERVRSELRDVGISCLVAAGGRTRQDSVRIAVSHFSDSISRVLVHDAARPFVTADLANRVAQGVEECGSCVPILPVGDTVKELREGKIVRTVPRESLGLAQTPQGFQLQLLVNAYEQAEQSGYQGTDESSLVEFLGLSVHVIPGDSRNVKITWKEDLQ